MSLIGRLRAIGAGLQREIIRDTAGSMLFIRIVEGLAAWILFNEAYLADSPQPWLVPAVLVTYLLVNLGLAYRYRGGDVRLAWVAVDLLANLLPIGVVIHLTGGITSPLVLVFVIKMGGYGFVYGLDIGVICMAGSVLLLAVSSAFSLTGIWNVPPPILLDVDESLNVGTRVALLALLIVGAFQLFGRIRRQTSDLRTESNRAIAAAERAHAAAERESNAAAIAGTLMVVSDAVSRVTRLEDVLNTVVEVLPRVLDIDYCAIFGWDDLRERYEGSAIAGVDETMREAFLKVSLTPEQAQDFEWVRRLEQCAVVPSLPETPLPGAQGVPALLLAPLHSSGRFFGVLLFARRHSSMSFTERDITVADGVADQVAVALERTVLIEDGRRMVQALDSTGECVVITDELGNVVYVNPSFLQTLGFKEQDLLGRDATTMLPNISPEWMADVVAAVLAGGWRGEARLPKQDGGSIPALLDINMIRDEKGEMQGAVAIFEDISERKRMEEQLHRADRLATAGEMAAGIAHEVNNALVGILRHASKARDEADPAALRHAFERVELQANRIAEIVQGLLGFARPRPPERQAVAVRTLIDEALEFQAYDLEQAHVVTEVDVAEGMPPVWVDPKQMQQVLVNLVANARQAMAEGGRLLLSARLAGRDVIIGVRDSGSGIAPDHLARIFDPFFTTKTAGTGLGLSVTYQIVRAHEGDITVESAVGEGTVFELRLPVAMAAHQERALVIDDDEDVGATLVEMLEDEGLRADRVLSGLDALARLDGASLYDVVFLDVRLPDLDGPLVFERLNAANPAQARRVIFVTGGLWRNEKGGLREALGSQPVLAKPCTAAQVRQALQELRHQLAA